MVKFAAFTLNYEGVPESKSIVTWKDHHKAEIDPIESNKRATLYIHPDKIMRYACAAY